MARSFQLVGTSAVKVLARLAARNAVKQQLRDQGVRMSLVKAREIEERARAYRDANPRLYEEALERARQLGMIELQPPMVTPDCVERNS
jgi:hypothetical protein